MSWRKILNLVCPIVYAVCLAVAYAQVRQWTSLAIVLLTFLAWLLARKRPSIELSSTVLLISVGLAAAGLFAGASPFLMMLSATFALASWDLVLLDHTLTDNANSSAKTIALFENRHYQNLALALGLSLLIAVAGQLIRLQIPLGGMILLVILALFGLDRVWRALVD
jgi:hypothetical protein